MAEAKVKQELVELKAERDRIREQRSSETHALHKNLFLIIYLL
jgi:hypothetical protein